MNSPYDSRYAQELHKRIVGALNEAHEQLGSGTQMVRDDASATGMNCAKYMGHIAGLKAAMELMKETDRHMNGKGT